MINSLYLVERSRRGSFPIEFGERVYELESYNDGLYPEPGMRARVHSTSLNPGEELEEYLEIYITYVDFDDHNRPIEDVEYIKLGESESQTIRESGDFTGRDSLMLALPDNPDPMNPCVDLTDTIILLDDSFLSDKQLLLNSEFQKSDALSYYDWLVSNVEGYYLSKGIKLVDAIPDRSIKFDLLSWLEHDLYSRICPR